LNKLNEFELEKSGLNKKIINYLLENGEESILKLIEVLDSIKMEKNDITKYLTDNVKLIIDETIINKEKESTKNINTLFNKYIEIITTQNIIETDKLLEKQNINSIREVFNIKESLTEKINKVEVPLTILSSHVESIRDSLHNKSAVKKGQISERRLFELLTKIFPSAEIEETMNQSAQGDFIIKRINEKDLLIENKNYTNNVGKKEIDKFIRDVKNGNRNGILLSQKSGISHKDNYLIEIIDFSIVMYVHNVNYEEEKIKLAINAMDGLSKQFIDLINKEKNTDIKINKNKLREFQNELSEKEKDKSELIKSMRKNFNKIIKDVEQFELPKFEIFEKNDLE